jgi:Sec7-like guanine-nucleotide exchange factor
MLDSNNSYGFIFNILILNTDFHKKTDKNKMKIEDFTKNLKMVLKSYMPTPEEIVSL